MDDPAAACTGPRRPSPNPGIPNPGPLDPRERPRSGRPTIDDLLEAARRGLVRLGAREAFEAVARGAAILVDTRSEDERQAQGYVREARHHPLSVLEWRLDPEAGFAWDADVTLSSWLVLLCREGYSSSLAAARLQALGFARATDVVEGVEGWKAAGLPLWATPT